MTPNDLTLLASLYVGLLITSVGLSFIRKKGKLFRSYESEYSKRTLKKVSFTRTRAGKMLHAISLVFVLAGSLYTLLNIYFLLLWLMSAPSFGSLVSMGIGGIIVIAVVWFMY